MIQAHQCGTVNKLNTPEENYQWANQMNEVKDRIGKCESEIQSFKKKDEDAVVDLSHINNLVTIEQMNELINDLQENINFLQSTTPRKFTSVQEQLDNIKVEIEDLKKYGQIKTDTVDPVIIQKSVPPLMLKNLKKRS